MRCTTRPGGVENLQQNWMKSEEETQIRTKDKQEKQTRQDLDYIIELWWSCWSENFGRKP